MAAPCPECLRRTLLQSYLLHQLWRAVFHDKRKEKKTTTAVVNVSVMKPEPEVTVNMLSKEKPNDHFFRCQSALCECVRARSQSGCEVCNLFVVRSDLQACCLMNILILN